MNGDSKAIHPFFKARKAVARDVDSDTTIKKKKRERSPSPPANINQRTTRSMVPKECLVTEAKLVASCSYSTFTPMQKPKFESEVGMPPTPIEEYDVFGLIEDPEKKKNQKSLDRLFPDRSIFGNGHLHLRELEPSSGSSPLTPKPVKLNPFFNKRKKKTIDTPKTRSEYFTEQHQQRQQQPKQLQKKKKITLLRESIHNYNELEAWLDQHFPHWSSFPSCVDLAQSITFSRKKKPAVITNQSWIDKYRPKQTACLLGSQRNSGYLKHWLHQMKIKPMSAPSMNQNNKKPKVGKKKHKKLTMDSFLDDSTLFFSDIKQKPFFDEDEDDEDFVMGPAKKQQRVEDIQSNVLLLVGDCGVGKTAAVYTAAEEVGYEVFEIHSGMKRSGKEIMAAVGDMTKNHLVTFEVKTEQVKKRRLNPFMSSKAKPSLTNGINNNGGNNMMKNFLRKESDIKKNNNKATTMTVTKNVTKQSLILLEDVDLLYEEDKGFWASVSELSQKSKRPIIMTCNDSSQIPTDTLYLQAILEMEPPSDTELLPYLWLVCFKEGFQVDPVEVICLMAVLGRDVRRLLQTLQLFCGENRIFGHYLGFDQNTSLLELKNICTPSKTAVDTFRLARFYQQYHYNKTIKKGISSKKKEESLDDINEALETMAFLDSWQAREEKGDKIEETTIDQINGFVQFTKTDEIHGETRATIRNLESNMSILSSQQLKTREWQDFILDEPSHWEELFDARCCTFDDYYDAAEKVLPLSMLYNPEENTLMMEYIPYIQAMIKQPEDSTRDPKIRQTRSKRKRLHLPLNDDQVDVLTMKRKILDETLFWCEHFPNK